MNKPKKLLRSDIRYECGDSAYELGRSYFEAGQVVNLAVNSEGALFVQLNATVSGGETHPYQQNIRIVWRPDYSAAQIKGDCSCPAVHNCEHVAAACLVYQNANQALPSSTGCRTWLDSLNEPAPIRRSPFQEFIAYILKRGGSRYEYTVDFLITKANKTGGLSKGRKTSLTTLRYSYSYLNYIQGHDEEIAKLMTALNTYKGEPLLADAVGCIVLAKLLQTGRLFWESVNNPPLKAGANRDLHFAWQHEEPGHYQLSVEIEPTAMLVLTDPPQYLDTVHSVIGALNPPVPTADQLAKILSVPQVPADYADEFSFKLTVEHPGLHLPAPKTVALTDLDEPAPVPRLGLYGRQLDARHYEHFMALSFDYGGCTLAASAYEDYSIVNTGQGYLRVKRALEVERQAIRYLVAQGYAVAVAAAGTDHPPGLPLICAANNPMDDAACWRDFIQYTRPELEQQGWIIEIDDSFKLDFQSAQNWDAKISESQNDWFEMHFNAEERSLMMGI